MPELLEKILAYSLLVLGFGFVVFFHELGHFLAAKWVGIKVEQFAIGFGQAIVSWRQGMGFVWGASWKKLDKLKAEGKDVSQYGETEYRWNWLPLGGYVKMLGQDDMDPNALSDDPRSYNRKSIGARMFVVSAGVIMNVILAFIFFVGLFLGGYHVQPARIGPMFVNSPAQLAGFQVGDVVKTFDGQYQHDFTKLVLNTALTRTNQPIPVVVERDGKEIELSVRPQMDPQRNVYVMGFSIIGQLRGVDEALAEKLKEAISRPLDPAQDLLPGDVITAVNGVDTAGKGYELLDRAVQSSGGKPVLLTVQNAKGETRAVKARMRFEAFFGAASFNIAGLLPQPMIAGASEKSPVKAMVQAGDVVTAIYINDERLTNPPLAELVKHIYKAGADSAKVKLELERDGARRITESVVPSVRVAPSTYGLGVPMEMSTDRPIVAGTVDGSAAARAGIPQGALIRTVASQEVQTWTDVLEKLRAVAGPAELTYAMVDDAGKVREGAAKTATLQLTGTELQTLTNIRYAHELLLKEGLIKRQTNNPLTAIAWGVEETRDLLLQFYVTLHRVFVAQSVSATNFMGPIGIVHAGSFFASRGWDSLVWFLAMISANLAVVNFLPIPIVDGGLFIFLIIERVTGKPLSPRMQQVAQLVGLAIILSIFLLVTYQDIRRIFL